MGDLTQFITDTALISTTFDPDGTMALDSTEINDIVCFAQGTMILTPLGEIPVEALRPGDQVQTRDHGAKTIRWVGSIRLGANAIERAPSLRPIRIRAGALGEGKPEADLVVSPQHRILVRSNIAQRMFGTPEVMVAAKQLLILDGIDIADDLSEVVYHHFLLDRHEVVISNGAETESLFTGPQALKSVGAAARSEIVLLFPQLLDVGYVAEAARMLPVGRQARSLAMRHHKNRRALLN